MTSVLIGRWSCEDRDMERHHVTMKAETAVMELQAQEGLSFPANPQKLRFQRPAGSADSMISDFQPPEI